MTPKNTICLWFDNDAHEAARFYAATFPDSEVTAVHKAPSDYPGGKKGDADEEGRYRHDRGGAAGLTWTRRAASEQPWHPGGVHVSQGPRSADAAGPITCTGLRASRLRPCVTGARRGAPACR